MLRILKYPIVVLDKISCQSFVDWTYEDSDDTEGRGSLLELHLQSAMNVGNKKDPVIFISSVTKCNFEEEKSNHGKEMMVSSLIEASKEIPVPQHFTEEESVLKVVSILSWLKQDYCILTGNILLYDKAMKAGFNVLLLKDSDNLFTK